MQTITDAQRAVLTEDLESVDFGCELLALDLTVTEDISDDFVGGAISRNMDATIHGTCRLTLSTELAWGNVLVRPRMILNGETFYCGVYSLTTPERTVGEDPVTYTVQGMDRVYLLDRQVGETYTIAAGTTYMAALEQVFTDAGLTGYLIDGEANDFTLPIEREWPLVGQSTDPDQTSSPVTWLRVVNDLQQAWNGRGVWADENGLYRCQKYHEPAIRASEFTFNADDVATSIVGQNRTLTSDIWKSPNRWVFLWSNRPGGMQDVEGDGMYTVTLDDEDPMSAVSRGLEWVSVVLYEAASQTVLESLGDRKVARDQRVSTTIKATTGPFPCAGHADVFTYVDEAAGGTRKVIATDWELDLTGGDTTWSWEAVG